MDAEQGCVFLEKAWKKDQQIRHWLNTVLYPGLKTHRWTLTANLTAIILWATYTDQYLTLFYHGPSILGAYMALTWLLGFQLGKTAQKTEHHDTPQATTRQTPTGDVGQPEAPT